MYECNPQNSYSYDLPFDGDQRLIDWQQIYSVNDDIVFRLNNGSIVDIYKNKM